MFASVFFVSLEVLSYNHGMQVNKLQLGVTV